MRPSLFLIFFLLIPGVLQGTHIAISEIQEIKDIEGNVISVRGFLYEGKGGFIILSDEPNLRTCCVGSQAKRDKQILVSGEINDFPLTAVTLRGEFHLDHSEGAPFLYHLDHASLVTEPAENMRLWPLAAIIIGILIMGYFMKKPGKSSPNWKDAGAAEAFDSLRCEQSRERA